MLSITGLVIRSPLDKKASEAPTSTVPAEAAAIPLPEPVAPVVKDTFGCCCRYAAAQERHSGASSVLPVSDRVIGPGAGPAGMPPPGDAAAEASGIVAVPVPPLHPAASVSGRTAPAASSRRDLSATDWCSLSGCSRACHLVPRSTAPRGARATAPTPGTARQTAPTDSPSQSM